jgi:hypothetical protein
MHLPLSVRQPYRYYHRHRRIRPPCASSARVLVCCIIIATQFQQAFSRISSSNLIAANTGNTPTTFGGGLWSAGEPINVYFNNSDWGVKTALIGRLPSKPSLVQPSLPSSESAVAVVSTPTPTSGDSVQCRLYDILGDCTLFTPMTNVSQSLRVANGGIDCTAQVKASAPAPNETWALMAFKVKILTAAGVVQLNIESCNRVFVHLIIPLINYKPKCV